LDSHGDALYAYALRRVRRPEVAEDLVQDTLLAALQFPDRFAQRSSTRTWLTGILKNKIADHLRVRYRHERLYSDSLEDDQLFNRRGAWKVPVPNWCVDPRELAERGEFRAALDTCMAKLPKRMAHLFICRASGDTTDQLCRELEITTDNAWMLLSRARSRLRQCLTIGWFTGSAEKNAADTNTRGAIKQKKSCADSSD
jgi:RNA polymerase sigma-70 factor (ECF subfamily)